jgi:transposase-like protein
MQEDTVVGLPRPGRTVESDPLLAVLRDGARRMLTQAIEAEVAEFLAIHADRLDEAGRRRVVRNGHAPEREIQTGIGPIAIRRPRVRDRAADEEARMRFASKVLPPFLRRTRNVEELLPWLYLKGISTGQFEETLTVLLGPDAPGLSSTTIRRLVATWQDEHERWQGRDLSTKRYVYVWADGVYFAPRLARDRQCILVLIGADASGRKELLAIDEADHRAAAEDAFERFLAKYQARYDKAAACLAKDRETLLAFYDFPAEHWKHIRTGNPIESTFATVRLRTDKSKGCLSRATALAFVFKLAKQAESHWRRLNGSDRLAEIIRGVRFRDGEAIQDAEEHAAA